MDTCYRHMACTHAVTFLSSLARFSMEEADGPCSPRLTRGQMEALKDNIPEQIEETSTESFMLEGTSGGHLVHPTAPRGASFKHRSDFSSHSSLKRAGFFQKPNSDTSKKNNLILHLSSKTATEQIGLITSTTLSKLGNSMTE